MIKDEFSNRYQSCEISPLPDYSLENISDPSVFSVDQIFAGPRGPGGPRCDEYIFSDLDRNTTGLVLVERKTASRNIQKIKRQLQGGANFITNFLQRDPALDVYQLEFKPILVSQKMKLSVIRSLSSEIVSLHRQTRRISHVITYDKLPPIRPQP